MASARRVREVKQPSQRAFIGITALLFAGSAVMTVVWCGSMSAMGGMAMPDDWTMSMAWMRMPGQSWSGAAASFVGMWIVMMVAMMLPSLVPMLGRYRQAAGGRACCSAEVPLGRLTTLVALGYFFVWTALGVIAFPVGVALATMAMQMPRVASAVPLVTGAVVVLAGVLQFSAWKARHLACCRGCSAQSLTLRADFGTAWRHGVRLGIHCVYCCAGLTAILLVVGVMDLRAMAVVAAAITLERLAPAGQRVARGIGVVVIAAGVSLIARALS